MTTLFTDLPSPKTGNRFPVTDPNRQVSYTEYNLVLEVVGEVVAYLETGILDASASIAAAVATITTANIGTATVAQVNATHIDAIADALPTVGPEMDWKGFMARWFIGIDVANSPTSRDFVLAGVRGTYSFPDGATTSGSPTLTSASGGGFVTALIGASITGSGIPAGTTITGVAGLTSLTLSANATITATGVQVTITRNTVQDLLYLKHRGALSPTFGIGVTPPNGTARLQVSPDDTEPAMGGARIRVGPTQTGKALTVHDSTPIDQLWIDKDFFLSGVSGVMTKADATAAGHVLTMADPAGGTQFSFDKPTGSGDVLRLRYTTGNLSIMDFGTDASVRHLSSKYGAFSATPVVKPTVTGSRGGNAALASLLTALSTLGWVTDSTTA